MDRKFCVLFICLVVGLVACVPDILDELDKKSSPIELCTYGSACTKPGESCAAKAGYTLECNQATRTYHSPHCLAGAFCDQKLTPGFFPYCVSNVDPAKLVTLVCNGNKLENPLAVDGGLDVSQPDAAAPDTRPIVSDSTPDAGPLDTGALDTSVVPETGSTDSGPTDTGFFDTGATDGFVDGSIDASSDAGADTPSSDTAPTDASDVGVGDTGTPDSSPDAGFADALSDTAPSSDSGDTSPSDGAIILSCATAPPGRITAIMSSPVPRPSALAGTIGFKLWTQYPSSSPSAWDTKPRCLAPTSLHNTMSCDLGLVVSGAMTDFIVGNVNAVTDSEFSSWYMNRNNTTGVRTMTGTLLICNGTTAIYGPSSILGTSGSVRWTPTVDPTTGLLQANVRIIHP